MRTKKRRLLLLIDMAAARHPIVHMYFKALSTDYDFAIASTDPEAVALTFPKVQCFQVKASYSVRALFGIRAKHSEGSDIDQVSNSDNGDKGMDVNLLFHHFHTTLWRSFKLRRYKPTAVIAIDGELLPTARLVAALLRIPYFYVACEVFPNQFAWVSKRVSRALAFIEMFGTRGAAKVFVPDVAIAKLLARRYGVNRSKFVAIGTCPSVPVQSAVGRVHSPLRVYYHGGYSSGRGLENLILAMLQISDAHLYMRVFGAQVEDLRRMTQDNNLEGRVTFLEPVTVDELPEASTEFDVGVIVACPTTANSRFVIGYKLFEYMAAGLSIVCPQSHVLGPFLVRHPIGVTYVGCETDAIVGAIRHCIEEPEKVRAWKKQARTLAEMEFNAEIQGERVRQVINDTLCQSS